MRGVTGGVCLCLAHCCIAHCTSLADRDAIVSAVPIRHQPEGNLWLTHPPNPNRLKPAASPSPMPRAPGPPEAISSAFSISEKAPEIASGQTGRVGFRAGPERRFDADRVGRLGRPGIPAVGRGFGCACRDVAVVCPGRLLAARGASLRMSVLADRAPWSVCKPCAGRPLQTAQPPQSAPIPQCPPACACDVPVSGWPAQGLVRTMWRPWCIYENAYCI